MDFAKVFKRSLETQYASGLMPLVAIMKLNKNVRFEKIGKHADANGQFDYAIQRAKRIKGGDAPANTGKAGTDMVALLDESKKIEWVTIGTIRSVKKVILIDIDPGEDLDMTGISADYRVQITEQSKNRMVEAEEEALNRLTFDAPVGTAAPVRKATGDINGVDLSTDDAVAGKLMATALKQAIRGIGLKVDDFKAYSDNIVTLLHPVAYDVMTDEAIESTGFSEGRKMKFNGKVQKLMSTATFKEKYPVFVHPVLNAITKLADDEFVLAIVMDAQAAAMQDPTKTTTQIKPQVFGDKEFSGATYHHLGANIDNERITIITGKLPASVAPSKKVND